MTECHAILAAPLSLHIGKNLAMSLGELHTVFKICVSIAAFPATVRINLNSQETRVIYSVESTTNGESRKRYIYSRKPPTANAASDTSIVVAKTSEPPDRDRISIIA